MRAAARPGNALPRIDFGAGAERCPACDRQTGVYKSRTRTVVTLAQGQFEARELLMRCDAADAGCPTVGSEELRRLVPPRQRYGYDLIVHVGLARYLGGRQREEIRAELSDQHGIELSDGTVSNLCDRFLVRLERLHLHRAPALRAAMESGYPLHLDATCEHGRGGLFVALDGWRGWVLGAARIPTEHQDHLQPLVDQVVTLFGDPVAVMRDMGEGIGASVEALRQRGVPDLVCHYHFLAAVGKKLLEQPYSLLRDALRRTGVRSELRAMLRELRRHRQHDGWQRPCGSGTIREDLLALVLWLLEGEGHKDPPFPFSRPHLHFVRRCERAGAQADSWVPSPRTAAERRALRQMRSLLARLSKERSVAVATERLDEGWQAFCELRDIMRSTKAELPRADVRAEQPHLPSLELLRLAEMERDLLTYSQDLDTRVAAAGKSSSVHAVVLRYLQRHGGRLFGHPARRDQEGRVLAVVARTNNDLEHLFGGHKQDLRRRLGRAHLARDLQQQPAQAALVGNLHHPDYVRVLCGSLDGLPDAFAELDGVTVAGATPLVRDHRDHRLHRRIKRLVEGTTTAPEHTAASTPPAPSMSPYAEVPQPLPDIEGLTEDQLRARCATVFAPPQDPRLPPPGAVLTRIWEGTEHQVLILDRGFEYQGQTYVSLSAIARTISGGRRNSGVSFFHLERLREGGEPKAPPRPAAPAYPLGSFPRRFRDALGQAGYGDGTITSYLGHVQRFANHHKRSPENMGNVEILQYLAHRVEDRNVSLGNYRSTCSALRACYRVSLGRPEAVDDLPAQPEAVRQLASGASAAAPTATAMPPPARSEAVFSATTVS